ncbi:SCO family protein [Propionivibrio sp.]|uniref:SCO family protein n=1 Tax=Propionivibrio sp. TaxID=2212460 RepID=UPI002637137E|nr:SCO family protein [Propionivibrio sp.]
MLRVLILILCLSLTGCSEREPTPFRSTDITGAQFGRALAGFKDHHGKPRTLADFQGKVVVLFFGYTFCPDICPTTLARFAEVMKLLGNDDERVQVLFVTLDPERDTAQKLADYVPWFYPSFIGLYGDMAATEAAAKEFKVFFARSKGSDVMTYAIDHSAGAYVFDPSGRIRLYVKDVTSVEAIVSDLKTLLAGK